MIQPEVWNGILAAVREPESHSVGEQKNALRVTFDVFCLQTFYWLFNYEATSRMDQRQHLNSQIAAGTIRPNAQLIASALSAALRASETSLHASDYSSHVESIVTFLGREVRQLVEALNGYSAT